MIPTPSEMASARLSAKSASSTLAVSNRDWILGLSIAFLWRIIVLLGSRWDVISGDGIGYSRLANSIAKAGVFSLGGAPEFPPTTLRAPLYPLYLALSKELIQTSIPLALLCQIAISIATIVLLTRCIARIQPKYARLTFWLLCLSPFEAFFCAVYLSEILCSFFVVAAMVSPWLIRSQLRWLFCGIFWGLAALTRDVYFVFPCIAALLMLLPLRISHEWINYNAADNKSENSSLKYTKRIQVATAIVLGTILIVSPWTIRNYIVTKKIIPISQGYMGFNLWVGTWEQNGNWLLVKDSPPFPSYAYDSAREKAEIKAIWPGKSVSPIKSSIEIAHQEPSFLRLAKDNIRTHPSHTVLTWLKRTPYIWIGTRSDLIDLNQVLPRNTIIWKIFKVVCFVINAIFIALSLIGIFWCVRSHNSILSWMLWPLISTCLLYLPFHSFEARYSQPVYSLLIVFASYGLYKAMTRFQALRNS